MRQVVRNLTGRPDEQLRELTETVRRHETLEAVLNWAQSQEGYAGTEEFVTQDEFTHDAVFAVGDDLHVVYGLT